MEQNIINILKKIRHQINDYVIKNNINFTTYDIPFKLNINFPILELDNNIEKYGNVVFIVGRILM
jgi:hypothetical protein|uniref:Uncharacterized protein n=1 Tax=Mimiviridae sp. ChoanoV1 TaxID=2596887 RepID=A0A5B8IQP5_9VIRU|nr:hypothetical protein 6_6 [Mimiviridae sp. ChoanoV1]